MHFSSHGQNRQWFSIIHFFAMAIVLLNYCGAILGLIIVSLRAVIGFCHLINQYFPKVWNIELCYVIGNLSIALFCGIILFMLQRNITIMFRGTQLSSSDQIKYSAFQQLLLFCGTILILILVPIIELMVFRTLTAAIMHITELRQWGTIHIIDDASPTIKDGLILSMTYILFLQVISGWLEDWFRNNNVEF